MIGRILFVLGLFISAFDAHAAGDSVARYTFAEGAGQTVRDQTGRGVDGAVVGAAWILQDTRPVLRFDGEGDYLDLGNLILPNHDGDLTVLAWIHLDTSPHPDETTNWAIVDCEDYRKEGFILRIDGGTSKLMYRSNQAGADQFGFGLTALQNNATYFAGVVCRKNVATLYVDGRPDGQFAVQPPGSGSATLKISSPNQSFSGLIYDVSLYDRALSANEVSAAYWEDAARFQKDVSARGTIRLRPFIYYDDHTAEVEADYYGLLPMASGENAVMQLTDSGGAVLQTVEEAVPDNARVWSGFNLKALAAGEYAFRATVTGSDRHAAASVSFSYPEAPFEVPSPERYTAEALPVYTAPPAVSVRVGDTGGFHIEALDRTFAVESSFSFPHGGDNRLSCAATPMGQQESEWQVERTQPDPSTWRVNAAGRYYRLERRIALHPGRVLISDTFTNLTTNPVGILFNNTVRWEPDSTATALLGGKHVSRPVAGRDLKTCPTAFIASDRAGVGLIALDDVSIVQARGGFDGSSVSMGSNEFALDAEASCTVEWAVYINDTGDYYDFVNAVRRDEGRNSVTVDGALAFVHGTQRTRDLSLAPDSNYFAMRNAAYATLYCLSWCTDDPAISVEGIEFAEYPEERARIRSMMEAMYRQRPDLKGMFHVAQQLYATNRPEERFADSRVIDADGNHAVYPYAYENGAYFSSERVADNWRWWIYYPTLDNSFGTALLDSVDVMMDEMGCRGAFVDGFLWGYGGAYTYDRWDGHSADIDPVTKTVTRRKGSVLLLTQDAMIAYCEKVRAKGGVVIANGVVPTRTICSQPLVIDREVNEGPEVHLAPTPITLGNPATIHTDEDLYRDGLNKLRAGNLYFFYGDPKELAYEPLPARMYPITVEEVHSGYIKGTERLVTLHSGTYGWPGSRDLHVAYRYDSRGHRVRPNFVTTVDAASVRTQIDLGPDEAVVIERIPVQIESTAPINVVVETFEEGTVQLRLNGAATVHVRMPDGTVRDVVLHGPERISIP